MKSNILITAYAVNPYKGSEDGIAWNIIKESAKHQKVIAITRENNQLAIDRYIKEHPLSSETSLEWVYFDLPLWMRFWKKGGRGALLYHYLWHLAVVFFIWKKRFVFDIAHHLNFNNDWTPSFLWLLGKPFIWGPIGHHPKIPVSYIKPSGKKAMILEQLKWAVKQYFWTIDPFLKITKWKAEKIIGLNSSVQKVLKVSDDKIVVIPAAGTERPSIKAKRTKNFQILSVGRMVALKGFDITIDAFVQFYRQLPKADQDQVQLVLIGKGPQKDILDKKIAAYQLPKELILSIDWMDREALTTYYEVSQVFFFPSHEGAGMVVPEALSYGIPILCFDNYGPGELMTKECGISIPYSNRADSIQQFSLALRKLYMEPIYQQELSRKAIARYEDRFTWEGKGLEINEIYSTVLEENMDRELVVVG